MGSQNKACWVKKKECDCTRIPIDSVERKKVDGLETAGRLCVVHAARILVSADLCPGVTASVVTHCHLETCSQHSANFQLSFHLQTTLEMPQPLSNFQAAALASILQNASQQIFLVQSSLPPVNDVTPHYDCPGFRLTLREQDAQKRSKFRPKLAKIIAKTIRSLVEDRNFTPLKEALQEFADNQTNVELVLRLNETLENRLETLKKELKIVSEEAPWQKNPAENMFYRSKLQDEETSLTIHAFNKQRYCIKFYSEKTKSALKKLTEGTKLITEEIQEVKKKIQQEDRCFHERESFLEMRAAELGEKLIDFKSSAEKEFTQIDNHMQILRIRTEFFQEEVARLEQVSQDHAVKIQEWKEMRSKVFKEKSAIVDLQTWWRMAIEKKAGLLPTQSK